MGHKGRPNLCDQPLPRCQRMCGRFTRMYTRQELGALYRLSTPPWSNLERATIVSDRSLQASGRRIAPRVPGLCLRAPVFEQLLHILTIELGSMRLLEVGSNVSKFEAN